jgi:hypothetical protein
MTRIAPRSAHPGRLRPSFFFWGLLCAQWALAQPAVYRCGQEYTNAPADAQRCERLALPSVTVIPGTKAQAPLPQAEASATVTPGADAAPQKQRDEMARRIVLAELDKARAQHAQLLQAWRQLPAANPPQPQAQALQASIERVARDIDSLQRELARKTP